MSDNYFNKEFFLDDFKRRVEFACKNYNEIFDYLVIKNNIVYYDRRITTSVFFDIAEKISNFYNDFDLESINLGNIGVLINSIMEYNWNIEEFTPENHEIMLINQILLGYTYPDNILDLAYKNNVDEYTYKLYLDLANNIDIQFFDESYKTEDDMNIYNYVINRIEEVERTQTKIYKNNDSIRERILYIKDNYKDFRSQLIDDFLRLKTENLEHTKEFYEEINEFENIILEQVCSISNNRKRKYLNNHFDIIKEIYYHDNDIFNLFGNEVGNSSLILQLAIMNHYENIEDLKFDYEYILNNIIQEDPDLNYYERKYFDEVSFYNLKIVQSEYLSLLKKTSDVLEKQINMSSFEVKI